MSEKINPITTLKYEKYVNISKPVINENTSNVDSQPNVKEGYTDEDLTDLYNTITDGSSTKREYDMDELITYPKNHPEYQPKLNDIVIDDINQQINEQYNTLVMTIAATASLGLIVFMLTSNSTNN